MVSISNDIMCFEGGVVEVSRSGTVKGKMTTESLSAVAWLQDFCNSYAEKLPNENKLNLPPLSHQTVRLRTLFGKSHQSGIKIPLL